MAARIPLATFYDWMEYAKRKPFGEERADLRAGFVASEIANSRRYEHKRLMRPIDFMPFSKGDRARPKQTPAQMSALLKGIVQLHKGRANKIDANANRS